MTLFTSPSVTETWQIHKPAVETANGIVVSQHYQASNVGAKILRDGGNAIDAAIATGLALGVVEPWMSGLGGVGYMLVYIAAQDKYHVVNFGPRAPQNISLDDYPLSGGRGADLFEWPAVVEDRNVMGPLSAGIPSYVAGVSTALQRFGTLSWPTVLEPAIDLAASGLSIDWYASLKIAAEARNLQRYPSSVDVYLPQGLPPACTWSGTPPKIYLGQLTATLKRLAQAGAEDFYHGQIAKKIVCDAQQLGLRLRAADLSRYSAYIEAPLSANYGAATVTTADGQTAGPALLDALNILSMSATNQPSATHPDAQTYAAYAHSLVNAYAKRLALQGNTDEKKFPSSTTHLCVADKYGNIVSLTQTLLSVFGSRVVLPSTGILMNNSMMWFDPRPGTPNTITPGARPLSNMCPTILSWSNDRKVALGASGGRRIFPAVMQLSSFLIDHGMSLEQAAHYPRIDYSGNDIVTADSRISHDAIQTIAENYQTSVENNTVYPCLFACPNMVLSDPEQARNQGAAFVMSPWAAAIAE